MTRRSPSPTQETQTDGVTGSPTGAELHAAWSRLRKGEDRRSAFAFVLFAGNAFAPAGQHVFRALVRLASIAERNRFLELAGSKSRLTAPEPSQPHSSAGART